MKWRACHASFQAITLEEREEAHLSALALRDRNCGVMELERDWKTLTASLASDGSQCGMEIQLLTRPDIHNKAGRDSWL